MRHGISTPSAQCLCQGFFTIEPEPNRRAKNEFVKSSKTKMMMKTCAAALLALAVAPSVQAEWTGNVMVVNLMSNYSLDFLVRHRALLSFTSFSFRLDLWWQPKGLRMWQHTEHHQMRSMCVLDRRATGHRRLPITIQSSSHPPTTPLPFFFFLQHCNASGKGGDATSTIKTFPQDSIKPGEVGRFYMDTGGIDWSVSVTHFFWDGRRFLEENSSLE